MSHLGSDRYDVELQAETARFAEAVRDADPARPVPTCPAWTLAQLTAHVGFGHRWAALIVERRATGPAPHDQADDLDVPKGAEQRSRWLRAGARWLADAVREAGPRTGVWSWAELELFPGPAEDRRLSRSGRSVRPGPDTALPRDRPGPGAAGEWLARRTPSGLEWEHQHDQSDVIVSGPVLDLLLVLSRRVALSQSRLEVTGDPRLLAHWLEHSRLEPA